MISSLPNQMFEIVVSTIATESSSFRERTQRIQAVSEAACALEVLLPETDLEKTTDAGNTEKVGEKILRDFNADGGFDDSSAPPAGGKFWYVVEELNQDKGQVYKIGRTDQNMQTQHPELANGNFRGVIAWQCPVAATQDGTESYEKMLEHIVRFAGATPSEGGDRFQTASIDQLWKMVAAIDGVIVAWGGSRFSRDKSAN